jgi:hypothetical protein
MMRSCAGQFTGTQRSVTMAVTVAWPAGARFRQHLCATQESNEYQPRPLLHVQTDTQVTGVAR